MNSNILGHSPAGRPVFIDTNTILYAVGNTISEASIKEDTSEVSEKPYFSSKNQITAFDYNKWLKVIAYAEYSDPKINFIRWPSGEECYQNFNLYHGMYSITFARFDRGSLE